MCARAQEAVGDGALAERLDQRPHAFSCQALSGVLQVRNIRGVQRRPIGAGGNHPGHEVQVGAADQARIFNRALEIFAEARLAAGQARGTALAARRVALRHVVQQHVDTRIARGRGDVRRLPVVGVLVFDGAESRVRRGGEALEKVHLDEQHGQVGGELRHSPSIAGKRLETACRHGRAVLDFFRSKTHHTKRRKAWVPSSSRSAAPSPLASSC